MDIVRIGLLLLILVPIFALAEGYGYLGGTIGNTQLDDDEQLRDFKLDDTAVALGVYGGYQFNRYFAVEGASKWLGRYQSDISSQHYVAVTGSALGILPVGESGFEFYGQAGGGVVTMLGLDYDVEAEVVEDDNVGSASFGPSLYMGLGVRYTPPSASRVTLRLGYEYYLYILRASVIVISNDDTVTVGFEDEDLKQSIGSFNLGAQYNF